MTSRRRFLADACTNLGAAWMTAHLPAIAAAHWHAAARAAAAQTNDADTAALDFLSPDEGMDVEAIAAQIVPTDDTPGAREAGVLYFIDRSLATWAGNLATAFHEGLRDFRSRFAATHMDVSFAAAGSSTQIAFLIELDGSTFFATVRQLTLLGMFASESYGGNRNGAGWKLLGFEDTHAFAPPFGYYDRDYPGLGNGGVAR